MYELEQIKKHPIKTHTIMIDDVRLFGSPEFDFITLDKVKKKLKEINSDYTFEYADSKIKGKIQKNDILIAKIKHMEE